MGRKVRVELGHPPHEIEVHQVSEGHKKGMVAKENPFWSKWQAAFGAMHTGCSLARHDLFEFQLDLIRRFFRRIPFLLTQVLTATRQLTLCAHVLKHSCCARHALDTS